MATRTQAEPTRADRKAAVEQAIAQLEAEGKPVSAQSVLLRTGGRRNTVQALVKEIRATNGSPPPRTSAQQEAADALLIQRDLQRQLTALTQKSQTMLLSPTETAEMMVLEKQLTDFQPIVHRAQAAAAAAQTQADIATLTQLWDALATQKRVAYEEFVESFQPLREAFETVLQIHREQESALEEMLPRAAQEKLSFPDVFTMGQRVIGRLPRGYEGLLPLLLTPQQLRAIDLAEVTDVDPGTRAIPPHLLAPYRMEQE